MFAKFVRSITRWARSPAWERAPRRTRATVPSGGKAHSSGRKKAPPPPPTAADSTRDEEQQPRSAEDETTAQRAQLRAHAERDIAVAAAELEARFERQNGVENARTLLRTIVRQGPGAIRQPPMAAQAVMQVCRRPGHRVSEMTALIERDPALAQKLLKHANSAYYAMPGSAPIVAINAAVQRIGTNGVYSTVMSSVIGGALSRPGAEFNEPAKQVWDHMVRVAPLARRLAKTFAVDAESAFTLGLVHDIGKLVLFDQLGEMRKAARREIQLPARFLWHALSRLHQPLGCLVALEWGMANDFARAIAGHHRNPPPETPDPSSELVFIAERADLAEIRGEELDLEALWIEGALTGSLEAVTRLFERMAAERAEAAEAAERARAAEVAEAARGAEGAESREAPESTGSGRG